MYRTRWWAAVLVALVLLASVAAIRVTPRTGPERAVTWLTVPLLVMAALTVWATLPRPARLSTVDLPELEITDLIFFLMDENLLDGQVAKVPRDFMMQLHVAVVNVGGGKGVVSAVKLDAFLAADDTEVTLPLVPLPLSAHQYVQRSGWQGGHQVWNSSYSYPPYVLGEEEAITLRFRCRRGLTWFESDDLPSLQALHDSLAKPIVKVRGTLVWRDARPAHRDQFTLPIKVSDQALYADWLARVTRDFSVRPQPVPRQYQLE